MAWLLCLAVGQASSLASSCCSTLFLLTRPFGEGPTVRIRFPPAASPLRTWLPRSGLERIGSA